MDIDRSRKWRVCVVLTAARTVNIPRRLQRTKRMWGGAGKATSYDNGGIPKANSQDKLSAHLLNGGTVEEPKAFFSAGVVCKFLAKKYNMKLYSL